MVKLIIFLVLFITFVYSNDEQNLNNFSEFNLPLSEIQTKLGEENQNIVHSIIDSSIEDKRIASPYKVDAFDRLNYNKESDDTTNKKDTEFKSTSIDNEDPMIKTSPKNNLVSINEGTNDPTINVNDNKRAGIDLLEGSLPARRLIPGIIEQPAIQHLKDYKLYKNKTLHDEDNIWNTRRNLFPNINKMFNSYDSEKIKKRNINELTAQEVIEEDSAERKFMDPTIGKGIFDMKNTKVMLMENVRVCYACSTMSNPTCWSPDKRTTVKYCQKGHQSCLTKTFQHKGTALIIRDCGSSCQNGNANEKYSACTMCQSDLCNSASTIYNTSVAMMILLGILYNRHI